MMKYLVAISEKLKEYNGFFIYDKPFLTKNKIVLYFVVNTEAKNISQFEDGLKTFLTDGTIISNEGAMDYWSFKDYLDELNKKVKNLKVVEEIDLPKVR